MPAPASELRQQLACSPLSLAPSHTAEISPSCKQLALDQELESASKRNYNRSATAGRGRRKVLADLAGNDSPIVGLVPGLLNFVGRTPASCELDKSALGTQNYASKPLIPPTDQTSINTPMGESLLRSQVKLLLQKVDSDAPTIHKPAPSMRPLCHLQTFTDSPALKLVAPTPINTPCGYICPCAQASTTGSTSDLVVSKPPDAIVHGSHDQKFLVQTNYLQQVDQGRADVQNLPESGIKLLVDIRISPEAEAEAPSSERLPYHSKASESGQITITESVLSGSDHHIMQVTPLISEAYDVEADVLALGKKTSRTLQFDSPDKVLGTDQMGAAVTLSETKEGLCSSVRELEEDEASVWSVLVNVGSPEQVDAELIYDEDSADSRNLQLNQKTPGWKCRKGTPFPKGTFTGDDDLAEDDESFSTEDEAEWKHSEEEEVICSKGLPRGEGKHIRFSYDNDDEMACHY
ncbi:hypothetical protein GOP47_0025608 [Adiantum capillus-veneris]|uniref:Uncharacterized protein n=1 Tax=Adiantum capillus-veneris TaxID=13818 RepID=A0A9D4Z342_ADICA|nr:hypothetical protein GOP47_0025608 [Adiantum capillus-veneris]